MLAETDEAFMAWLDDGGFHAGKPLGIDCVNSSMRYSEIMETKFVLSQFQLPTEKVEFYDDPTRDVGDEGWTTDEIAADMESRGGMQDKPIEVGRSRHDMQHNNDFNIYAFNGNHRLAACKKLKRRFVLCVNSDTDDAQPLTFEDILALGGHTIG